MLASKDADLALLTAKLGTPLTASDIISGKQELNDEVRFALHDEISDKQPDTALLAIAASAQYIAAKYAESCPNLKLLARECDRVIEEYGALWLQNARGQDIDSDEIMNVLAYTAEDLEGMGELLEYAHASLQDVNNEAAELCDILQVQARAHTLVAEAFIEAADRLMAEQTSTPKAKVYENNVIPFPALRV